MPSGRTIRMNKFLISCEYYSEDEKSIKFKLQNQKIKKMRIHGKFDDKEINVLRSINNDEYYRQFAEKNLNANVVCSYILQCDDENASQLQKAINKKDVLFIDLDFEYLPAFFWMHIAWKKTGNELYNLAWPDEQFKNVMNRTYTVSGSSVTLKPEQVSLTDVPIVLRNAGDETKVISKIMKEGRCVDDAITVQKQYTCEILFKNFDDVQQILSLDYTELYENSGKAKGQDTRTEYKLGDTYSLTEYGKALRNNISINQKFIEKIDVSRGKKILEHLYDTHKTKTADKLVDDLRLDIDKYLVIANLPGRGKEQLHGQYQNDLSYVLAHLDENHGYSHPFFNYMNCIRKGSSEEIITKLMYLGLATCKDHALITFELLKKIIKNGETDVKTVVSSGYANIDHAFCIYGLEIDVEYKYAATDKNKVYTPGENLRIFNLDTTKAGYVCDPYLENGPKTTVELLDKMNSFSSDYKTQYLVINNYFNKDGQTPKVSTDDPADPGMI